MRVDELERKTHEQIRALQDEYRQRLAPLYRVLVDIETIRPMRPAAISKEQWDSLLERVPLSAYSANPIR